MVEEEEKSELTNQKSGRGRSKKSTENQPSIISMFSKGLVIELVISHLYL